MSNKQRTWGQFATPVDVADLLLGFCLRRADDRVLDPSCGDGALLRRAAAWQGWLSAGGQATGGASPGVYGVELDPEAAATAATIPGASIELANFLTLDAGRYPPFDAIVGNPPYTRAEWIERLDAAAGQLPLFDGAAVLSSRPLLSAELGAALDGRAGLYAYFFLHCLTFLREGGRLGFVVPNGWLDVAYGEGLKRFLLAHFRVVAVVESAAERWFAAAGVNTCVVVLERAADPAARAANRVRFVRLNRPLRDLLGPAQDARRVAAVERLVARLLPASDRTADDYAVRVRSQAALGAAERWGQLLRAPDVFLRQTARPVAPLGAWADVQRGQTTGANDFFYLDRRRIDEWGIAPGQRRPLLKSLRRVHSLRPATLDDEYELLTVTPGETAGAARYLDWGVATGVAARPTCAGRRPWYVLPAAPPGPLLLAKGVWQRHFAPLVDETVAVDQQLYRVAPAADVSPLLAAALLNSAWFALGCELGGRVNLGEGVLWLASYELRAVRLPDPRALSDDERRALETAFLHLAEGPVGDTAVSLEQPARWALDELVFDALGLPADERAAARAALRESLAGRRRRARKEESTDPTDI